MTLDLELNESEVLLRNAALDFLRRDTPKLVVQGLLDTDTGTTDELWQKAADMGWLGIIIPQEYGGSGYPLTSAGVLFEALGTAPLPGPHFSSTILGSLVVLHAGNEGQKLELLPALARGEETLALAMTEPNYGWDPASIETTATSSGGEFALNGTKTFTMDALAASKLIVVARTASGSEQDAGISLFLVDRESEGVSVRRLPGFLSGRTFEVELDGVKVPRSTLLGQENMGWAPLQQAITEATPILCTYKAGGCQAVIEMTLNYSRIRVQFGQAIGRFQRVQDMIIDMVTHSDAAKWASYEALWKLDTGQPAIESVHTAKVLASQGYWEVVTLGHQVFSGVGYSRESPISFHTRTSRSLHHYLGEPSHHRQELARMLVSPEVSAV
ncbi:MAG TPA: acyl-CoA dehydrogenase family protein [Dehalococcoidia bacterium]|nr:acyl-CoA dehydrogenase family protein [Dehalococcoidia bacterium]